MAWDMETDAVPFYGTLLQMSIDLGVTYKKVAEVKSISGPSASAETIDTTHVESPNKYREFIGGLKDGGEFTVELNFNPVSLADTNYVDHEVFLGYLGVKYDYQIVWPDAGNTIWGFKAILTSFQPSGDVAGAVSMSCTVKVAGAMDLSV